MHNNNLKIAVLWRPGRNVEWQRKFLGKEIPDDAVEEATLHRDGLREVGYQAELVEWRGDDLAGMLDELGAGKYDLVFNASSMQEVSFLEIAGIPFVGSGLDLVPLDKATRKKLWMFHDIPTAPFVLVDRDELAGGYVLGVSDVKDPGWRPKPPLDYPMFVKPVRGRGSSGISDDSIVEDRAAMAAQAEKVVTRLNQGALVESYLQGREVTVGIIGNPPLALTPLEIEYNQARTNTYEHKMDNEIMHVPARISEAQLKNAQNVAMRAFQAVGARDYARVDTIVDAAGQAYVLELNTFAGLQILTGEEKHLHASYIGKMAEAMGMNRADVLGRIVGAARGRYGI